MTGPEVGQIASHEALERSLLEAKSGGGRHPGSGRVSAKSPNLERSMFGGHDLPRHVSLAEAPFGADSRETAETIFLMSAAPDDVSLRGGRGAYLAVFEADCLACNEEGAAPAEAAGRDSDVMRVRGKVVAPRLVNRVEPLYLEEARRLRQEGVSIYEAIISPTGCVRQVSAFQEFTIFSALPAWRRSRAGGTSPRPSTEDPCPCT
jgi:hypothetical protein